jgi:ubiquinone/menaquinone biosynthesis C-methylase UbiE
MQHTPRITPLAVLLFLHAIALLLLISCAGTAAPAEPTTTAEPTPRTEASDESVRPGINESFKNPELDPKKFVNRFEVESREIFFLRHRIAKQLELKPGMAVADVGAGTGLFMDLLSRAVGPEGKVYGIDIAPKLIDYMRERAEKKGHTQFVPHLCTERSVELPANSVDVVFVCDTYHHFEYPQQSLASIHQALRPGGRLVVVDFERIPGKSRKWVLGHVRAGKEVFTAEIEAAGFALLDEPQVGLKENYLRRFVKK